MLSLGKLAAGQAQYYLDTVARGAEEYYTGAKEAPGQWCGTSAPLLGLTGEVDGELLHRLLRHRDPHTDSRLTASRSVPKVVGFDATFSAPKGVSLTFALGDPEVSNEVRNAHDVAVAEALRVYEQIASGRRGKGGARSVDGDGFAAAAFRHRTSRAADPQLHTHVVIANLVHAQEDGRWTALDGRPLYTWARPVGFLYEAHLRWELTRRLGVDWTPIRNGIGDIVGFSPAVLKAFSTRRAEIDERLAILGQEGAKATQDAVYKTRKPKDPTVDIDGLLPEWRQRADALGLDERALEDTLHRVEGPRAIDRAEVFAALSAPEGLTAKRSTFGRKQVIEAVCSALPHGGRVEDVLDVVDDYLASEYVIALSMTATPPLRVTGGRLVPAGAAEAQWTTPDMVATEQRLLAQTAHRQREHTGIARAHAVTAATAARPTLTAEQRRMVDQLCSSGHGVDVIEGVAGSGKTYALAAARQAWEASGYQVRGASLAARAARRLEEGSGIASTSIDRLLNQVERHQPLTDRDVLVVDEAAMVGTRKLVRLLDYAAAARAKVVLVGDPRQLPEIDAGGAFAGLARRIGDATLTDNRRQSEPWERAALVALRAGDVDTALAAYTDHGRIHHPDDPRGQLLADWWTARTHGDDALMVAPRLSEVDDLNRRARHLLRAHRQLSGPEIPLGARTFATGDQVVGLRNDYSIGILNGTTGTIMAIDQRRRAVAIDCDGNRVVVPFDYAQAGHLAHGYATTLHKAQGATVDRVFVLVDETYAREHLYTALSRGRLSNDLYLDDADRDRTDVRHAPEVGYDPHRQLRHSASRSGAHDLAVERGGDRLTPMNALVAERRRLHDTLSDGPDDPTRELHDVQDQIRRHKTARADAVRRKNLAVSGLEELGPLGRRVHRRQRDELKLRVDNATKDIARADDAIARLADRANELTAELPTYRRWHDEHRPQIERFREVTLAIHDRRMEVVAAKGLERGRDFGIEL